MYTASVFYVTYGKKLVQYTVKYVLKKWENKDKLHLDPWELREYVTHIQVDF